LSNHHFHQPALGGNPGGIFYHQEFELPRTDEGYFYCLLWERGGEQTMANVPIYVTQIIKGNKTISKLSNQENLRNEVKKRLEALGFPELAQ